MTNIIDRLFLLSKFENIELNISTIKISELFNKILNDYKILGIDRIQISRDFGEINADKKLFLEGIRILVDNALKFSEKEIILDSYSDDDFHYISVKDFGVGIEEKETGKIFERFYKIDESRNSKNNGLGLGLSIIEEIVKAHSGKLIIDSKVNVGSSFIIRIRKYICQN
jgi:signal transduction histidine kinase